MTTLLAVVALFTSTFDLVTSSEGVSRGALLSFAGKAIKPLAISLAGLITTVKGAALVRNTLLGGGMTSMWKTGARSVAGSITCCTEEVSNRHCNKVKSR